MESARHPLEILPAVVWLEVFKNLSSADCRSCYNSCAYFRYLLKPSVMRWNFKEVLPLILGKGQNCFGYLKFRLRKTDMLNCRLVCEAWRTPMDYFIGGLQETPEVDNFQIHFYNEELIDRFFTDMTRYHFNFLLKNILLGVRNAEEDFEDPNPPLTDEALDAFWEKCYVLLQAVGMHVTQICIEGIEDHTPAGGLKITKIVQRCLTLLPKVKELNIANRQLEDLEWRDDFTNEMNEIDEYFTNNPLPPLPHLKSLVMQKSGGCLPVSLIKHLTTTYGPQLESMTAWTLSDIPAQYNFQILRNLKKLDIETCDVEDTISNNLNFLGNLNCRLEIMRLDIKGPNEPMSIVNFLEQIQNLPIKELELQLSLSYEELIPDSIRLVTTKSLSLTVDSRYASRERKVSFDFLTCFPNLEKFEFTWWHDANNGLTLIGNENRIRLNDHFNIDGSLYHSNVWKVLPKLESLTYRRIRAIRFQDEGHVDQKQVYTRQQYQIFRQRLNHAEQPRHLRVSLP